MNVFIAFFMMSFSAFAVPDPRLAKSDILECVNIAKKYLNSGEYDTSEKQMEIIGACRDVEPNAVKIIAEHIKKVDTSRAETFLPLIRSARGKGMDQCYLAATSILREQEYDSAEKAQGILKKCE